MYLQVRDISKSYNGKKIIEKINIDVKDNEIVSILGKSGVGKTTLFNIISGLEKPETGSIILNNEDITGKTGKISYMLQKDLLLPNKTILENVELPLRLKGNNRSQSKNLALSYFKLFHLCGCENKYPSQISGGMKQRAAFLRTYLFSNNMVLLDEPFSALDNFTKTYMYDWYLGVSRNNNISSLIITHDIDEAIILSDRIYVLLGDPGEIQEEITIPQKSKCASNFYLNENFIEIKKRIFSIMYEPKDC